jgi:hypothetical protein
MVRGSALTMILATPIFLAVGEKQRQVSVLDRWRGWEWDGYPPHSNSTHGMLTAFYQLLGALTDSLVWSDG